MENEIQPQKEQAFSCDKSLHCVDSLVPSSVNNFFLLSSCSDISLGDQKCKQVIQSPLLPAKLLSRHFYHCSGLDQVSQRLPKEDDKMSPLRSRQRMWEDRGIVFHVDVSSLVAMFLLNPV